MSMSTSCGLQTRLDDVELARLLRRRVAGEPFPHSFIHEADVCSLPPEELVVGREHAPGTDRGDGKGIAWYFCSPANYHETSGKRKREVGGGGGVDSGKTFWYPERRVLILGPDKNSVGAYKRTLSYVLKITNPPGAGAAKSFRKESLGWIMLEIGLEQLDDDGADQKLVLCKVYKSPLTSPQKSTEASSTRAGAEDVCPAPRNGQHGRVDSAREAPGGVMPCSALSTPALCDNQQVTECRLGGEVPSAMAIVKKAHARSWVAEETPAATVVLKLGGSSIPSAERIKEMAKLVLSFANPVVVLSAMGDTTTNILLAAWKALRCGTQKTSEFDEFKTIRELHLRTIAELGLDKSIITGSLDEFGQYLQDLATTKTLKPRTQDYLVSFGEQLSTRMFSEYLNKLGKETFQEWEMYDVTTSGRASSDLTAATIGRELGSTEIQVWKDVDGVLTCDPKVCKNAIRVPYLTFDEAIELGFFDSQSMQIAMEGGIKVTVKNSYNPRSPGTVITQTRDKSKSILLTNIVLKSNVTVMDIKRTSMLSRNHFVAKAFSILNDFENLGISVDCVDSSEGNMSITLVPSELWSTNSIKEELDNIVEEFQKFADVCLLQGRSVICLVGNRQMSPFILETAFSVLRNIGVNVQKISHGSSKVMKISIMVDNSEAVLCVQAFHWAFFELNGSPVQVPENSPVAAASSSDKRKAYTDTGSVVEETERATFPNNHLMHVRDQNEFFVPAMTQPAGTPLDVDDYLQVPVAAGVVVDGGDLARSLHGTREEEADQQGLVVAAESGSVPEVVDRPLEEMSGNTGNSALREIESRLLSDDDPVPVGGNNVGLAARIFNRISVSDDWSWQSCWTAVQNGIILCDEAGFRCVRRRTRSSLDTIDSMLGNERPTTAAMPRAPETAGISGMTAWVSLAFQPPPCRRCMRIERDDGHAAPLFRLLIIAVVVFWLLARLARLFAK